MPRKIFLKEFAWIRFAQKGVKAPESGTPVLPEPFNASKHLTPPQANVARPE
jgi:hypothetical protein